MQRHLPLPPPTISADWESIQHFAASITGHRRSFEPAPLPGVVVGCKAASSCERAPEIEHHAGAGDTYTPQNTAFGALVTLISLHCCLIIHLKSFCRLFTRLRNLPSYVSLSSLFSASPCLQHSSVHSSSVHCAVTRSCFHTTQYSAFSVVPELVHYFSYFSYTTLFIINGAHRLISASCYCSTLVLW